MHPTRSISCQKSNELEDKKIILGVTGSIAAIMSVKLARELIRNGAEVQAVMTDSAREIIHPQSLKYATGNRVIKKITGEIEHVREVGEKNEADLLLIAPSTANTIGKIASGIDDTPVTTFATTAMSTQVPITIVPAMHESMLEQPIVSENIDYLKKNEANFVEPKLEENKAKMARIKDIIFETKKQLTKNDLKSQKILITGGATQTKIDEVRVITNNSSGQTGKELAKESAKRGAEVTFIHGNLKSDKPIGSKNIEAINYKEMKNKVLKEIKNGKYDYYISSAAISDFKTNINEQKLDSSSNHQINLKRTDKIIRKVKEISPKTKIIPFKLEKDFYILEKEAKEFLTDSKLIVGNKIEDMEKEKKEYLFIKENNKKKFIANKKEMATKLFDFLSNQNER